MILETECFSINSDISRRMRVSGVSNSSWESTRTSSVLPVPVGPTKMKEAGCLRGLICTRLRRTAAETAFTASSWPMIFRESTSSRWASLASSFSSTRAAGMPVHSSMT